METLAGGAQLLQEGAGDRRLQSVAVDRIRHHLVRAAHLCLTAAEAVAQRAPPRGGQTGEGGSLGFHSLYLHVRLP